MTTYKLIKKSIYTVITSALLLSPLSSHAIVLISNINNIGNGSDKTPTSNSWYAQGFTTDASTNSIGNIQIKGSNPTSETIIAEIYADSSNHPNTQTGGGGAGLVGTFFTDGTNGSTSLLTSSSTGTYTANGTINLAASTSYWIVMRISTGGSFNWETTTNGASSGPASLLTPPENNSNNGLGGFWFDNGSDNLRIEVNTVPEPATYAFIFGGLIILWVKRKRLTPLPQI